MNKVTDNIMSKINDVKFASCLSICYIEAISYQQSYYWSKYNMIDYTVLKNESEFITNEIRTFKMIVKAVSDLTIELDLCAV